MESWTALPYAEHDYPCLPPSACLKPPKKKKKKKKKLNWIKCKTCEFKSKHESNLRQHEKAHLTRKKEVMYDNTKKFKCDICDFT